MTDAFTFQSAEEFESKARDCLAKYVPRLAGKRFHVRMHRRGWKQKLGECDEEQFLGGILFEALEAAGTPGEVSFNDPDVIVAVETLDNRAGVAAWTRQDLQRYPFLKLD